MSRNVATSVHQRLLNLARSDGRRFNDVLQHYALERWLYRLSQSPHGECFVLKGALVLMAWKLPVWRPTRDIDLLARTDNDLESVRNIIEVICQTEVIADGMIYDGASITTERIAEDALYEGIRAAFRGNLGQARTPMQIDLGFSDVVTPAPVDITYPTALGYPAPILRAYNAETSIAEKLEAMVKLGELNSRMKDFFDIWTLARNQPFDSVALGKAIDATFRRRGTSLDPDAVCFQRSFGASESKQAQWRAPGVESDLGLAVGHPPGGGPVGLPRVARLAGDLAQSMHQLQQYQLIQWIGMSVVAILTATLTIALESSHEWLALHVGKRRLSLLAGMPVHAGHEQRRVLLPVDVAPMFDHVVGVGTGDGRVVDGHRGRRPIPGLACIGERQHRDPDRERSEEESVESAMDRDHAGTDSAMLPVPDLPVIPNPAAMNNGIRAVRRWRAMRTVKVEPSVYHLGGRSGSRGWRDSPPAIRFEATLLPP